MLVATIGNFDGVHLGHRALVAAARAAAGAGGRTVAVTFEPLPASVLRAEGAPARLTPGARRAELLREAGCDEVLELDPRGGLLSDTPEEFVARLRGALPFDAIAEGGDFRFGRGRAGDVGTLRAIGDRLGFGTLEVAEQEVAIADGSIVAARSSAVRWMLAVGRVADAALLLGRPHEVAGTVEPGDRRGRGLGFPTANVHAPGIALPADGVYAGDALVDGALRPAAISIGTKPTFGRAARTLEVHVVGLERALDDYGWAITVRFRRWLREQWRFPGPDALAAQLRHDVAQAAALA
jgi:riboflavin kinase/FMN adenylyltransferase